MSCNKQMHVHTHCWEISAEPTRKDAVRQDVVFDRNTVPKCPSGSHWRGDLTSRGERRWIVFSVTVMSHILNLRLHSKAFIESHISSSSYTYCWNGLGKKSFGYRHFLELVHFPFKKKMKNHIGRYFQPGIKSNN